MLDPWYERPLDRRAPRGGETGVDGRERRGGEFEPFYVPRAVMPQLDESDYPGFFAFCEARGVTVESVTLAPSEVRPHQRVDHDKARHMDDACLAKPILTSVEPFVLDGHHRWARHAELGSPIPAYRLTLDFERAVELLFAFPKTYAYGDGAPHPQSF